MASTASRSLLDNDGINYCKGARTEKMALLKTRSSRPFRPAVEARPPKSQSSDIVERMNQLEQAMAKDNFVKDIKKMDKADPNYGKPQEGNLKHDDAVVAVELLPLAQEPSRRNGVKRRTVTSTKRSWSSARSST
jgi:hypothetical protein